MIIVHAFFFIYRYNPYDIAPLYTLTADQINKFYESYNKLGNEIKNPENEFWIKLKPDMVLFVDNWRVLHGRSAFTGSRHVSGCYLPYDDWTSIARAFGLINLWNLKHRTKIKDMNTLEVNVIILQYFLSLMLLLLFIEYIN